MTRQEQILAASMSHADKAWKGEHEHAAFKTITMADFSAGAMWADQHPNWIPVKEERPKVSGDYIIREKRGFVKEAHYFELDDLWMLPGGALVSPTHWMPLPQSPRKEVEV